MKIQSLFYFAKNKDDRYVDIRKSINGLPALVKEGVGLNPFQKSILSSAIWIETKSKSCIGIETAFGCITNG